MKKVYPTRTDRVFVITIDGRAVVAFEALSLQEARSLLREGWLQEDLRKRTHANAPMWDGSATLSVRAAHADESAEFQIGLKAAKRDANDDLFLAYLQL